MLTKKLCEVWFVITEYSDTEFHCTLAAEFPNNKLTIQNKKQVQIKTVTTIALAQWMIIKKLELHLHRWLYLLRAKFRNDSNLLVHEIGRRRDVGERSLKMTEVSQGGGRRWWNKESGLQIFWKKIAKVYLVCLFVSVSWQQIRRWDMTCDGFDWRGYVYCSVLWIDSCW